MAQNTPALPLPNSEQAYCNVAALEGGLLILKSKLAIAGAADDDKHVSPSLAFLLTHVRSGKRLLFDLGVCGLVPESPALTPPFKNIFIETFEPRVPQDVPASLMAGGLSPSDITQICFSHVHFDHVGNPTLFPNARFLVGSEARALFEPGYPEDPNSPYMSTLLPEGRTDFLDTKGADWKPIGPFPCALDYFNNGSLYIVDAPGHLLGHLNMLVRTSSDGGWIYLAGDSAHDWRLIPTYRDGEICMHHDKEQAAETIRKIAGLMKLPRVRVLLAHDNEWFDENRVKFKPELEPQTLTAVFKV
ncbi:hypothetical protein EW145_g1593 [Phellinidium pouzarii]|uniref:Metallo-beta-lactamase domain-containing protein n=1 Tax=Phellinidium pouzarii TaxID=167371 RepID=A0A4S4LFN2_9AGAM|nr:hypothetical protein EW145_g1593 [Phellinidium pouzarii]